MQSKTGNEQESTLLRGVWTRRAFCNALGLSGLTWALPAYPLAPPQPWPPCVGSFAPAPHQRIDAHVHIFNGTDLQIAGWLKGPVSNENQPWREVLQLLADPLQFLVWGDERITAKKELEHLNEIAGKSEAFSEQDFGTALRLDRAETQAQYNKFLSQQLGRKEVRDELIKMIAKKKGPHYRSTIDALRKAPPEGKERDLARRVDELSGIYIFDFLERFFSYRYSNFLELVQQFTCSNTSSVDTFIALLVDFDQPLGQPPGATTPSSIDDQTAVISRICRLSRGHLIALAPYCPFKDAAFAPKHPSLDNVLNAWQRPGFVGAKLYPPMGFFPYSNPGKHVDEALAGLYHECIQSDAVVMAHAGPSYCVTPGPCEYPGPKGWATALETVFQTEHKPLRAAVGHFGGPFDKKHPEWHIWPEAFLDLMQKPSGQKFYADLSYANEVLSSSPRTIKFCVNRLKSLMTRSSSPALSDRLMYGSDWLLLGLDPQWRKYATRMEAVIDETEKESGATGFKARFFGGNARDWLGLNHPTSLGSRNTISL
jgi:predicted TIM-barrel fold metal-dependent hydrolase